MKLFNTLLFALIIAHLFGQGQVINIGSSTMSAFAGHDAYIDAKGNQLVSISTEKGVFVSYLDEYFVTKMTVRFDSLLSGAGGIKELSEGNFFLSFRGGNSPLGAGFARLDSSGALWHKLLPNNSAAVIDFVVLDNGNVAMLVSISWQVAAIIVVDQSGNIVWGKEFSKSGKYVKAGGIVNTNDQNITVLVQEGANTLLSRVQLVKFDYSGNLVWEKAHEQSGGREFFVSLMQATTGDYYVIGSSGNLSVSDSLDILIRKFNSTGDYIDGMTYGNIYGDQGRDLVEDDDGNFRVIAEVKPLSNCAGNLLCMKIKPNLDTVYTKLYGEPSGAGAFYWNIKKRDDTYYTLGWGSNWTFPGESQAHLLKMDDDLNLPCLSNQWGINLSSPINYTTVTPTISYPTNTLTFVDGEFENTPPLRYYDACSTLPIDTFTSVPTDTSITNAPDTATINPSDTTTSIPSRTSQAFLDYQVSVFPNPTNGTLQLELLDEIDNMHFIEIYDIYGKLCLSITLNPTNNHTLDLSNFSSGIYLIVGKTDKGLYKRKISKY